MTGAAGAAGGKHDPPAPAPTSLPAQSALRRRLTAIAVDDMRAAGNGFSAVAWAASPAPLADVGGGVESKVPKEARVVALEQFVQAACRPGDYLDRMRWEPSRAMGQSSTSSAWFTRWACRAMQCTKTVLNCSSRFIFAIEAGQGRAEVQYFCIETCDLFVQARLSNK